MKDWLVLFNRLRKSEGKEKSLSAAVMEKIVCNPICAPPCIKQMW